MHRSLVQKCGRRCSLERSDAPLGAVSCYEGCLPTRAGSSPKFDVGNCKVARYVVSCLKGVGFPAHLPIMYAETSRAHSECNTRNTRTRQGPCNGLKYCCTAAIAFSLPTSQAQGLGPPLSLRFTQTTVTQYRKGCSSREREREGTNSP